jgi:gluconolactonase
MNALYRIGFPLLLLVAPAMAADKPVTTLPDDIVSPGAKLERVVTGRKFTEGPVWVGAEGGGGYLAFSDIPNSTIHKWSPEAGLSVLRHPSNQTNGNTLDREGRLISCEHEGRRVVRTESDGSVTVLADAYEGHKLNSPNDAAVKSDGTIWFTDPPYGVDRKLVEQPHNNVFRLDPETKKLVAVAADFDMPNGICFSPDEKTLYVADSGRPHHIRAFEVKGDNTLGAGRVFAVIDQGVPDGIRCDAAGRVWSSAGDGAQVFSPEGKLLGRVLCPETPANLAFGGKDGRTLFLTARTSVYAIPTTTTAAGK